MSKKYENVTVSIDEEFGYISVKDNMDKHIGSYYIKTEKEREELQDLPLSRAMTFSIILTACLALPMAYIGIVNFCNGMSIIGIISILLINIFGAAIAFAFLPAIIGFIVQGFNFNKYIEKDKRLIPALIIIVTWSILFVVIANFGI